MAQPVLMPKLGQSLDACTLARWLKKEGDRVAVGEALFEVETGKAVITTQSFHEGTLLRITAPDGSSVEIAAVVGYIGAPGEAVPDAAGARPSGGAAVPAAAAAPGSAVPSASGPVAETDDTEESGRVRITPRARRLAREKGVDISRINGTGPGGRITEKDVAAFADSAQSAAPVPAPAAPAVATPAAEGVRATPAARELAAAEGIDLATVVPSGDDGRVTREDVEEAAAARPREMSRMRRIIAERLTQSFASTPHFYVTVAVDVTELMALRAELKARGAPYTLTDFVLKAVADSLVEFPNVNSSTDGRAVSLRRRVHLGLAVSVEGGLVVPVVRDADRLPLRALHAAAAELAERARTGKLLPEEMQGGTFTVSNMGMLNVDGFAAIINPGEAAILAIATARQEAVVHDGAVAVRTIMRMTLSTDHRVVDGAEGAAFANAVKRRIEDTAAWRALAGW